jgi:hypothetical protein
MLGTFFIVVGRLFWQTHTCLNCGIGEIVRKALDLSFVGTSGAPSLWIEIFTMQALLNHLMHREKYLTNYKQTNQRITDHFVRVR